MFLAVSLGVCGVCSKPESDHGTPPTKFERKKFFLSGRPAGIPLRSGDESQSARVDIRNSAYPCGTTTAAVTQACYIKSAYF